MNVEARLLLLQHLNRTALRTLAGDAGTLDPAVKKRVFAAVEGVAWEVPEEAFEGVDVAEEGWEADVAADPRVREPFEEALAQVRSGA